MWNSHIKLILQTQHSKSKLRVFFDFQNIIDIYSFVRYIRDTIQVIVLIPKTTESTKTRPLCRVYPTVFSGIFCIYFYENASIKIKFHYTSNNSNRSRRRIMKYILGLDIGIASVGYGLIDKEKMEIIDAGVRLFKEGNKDDNANGRRPKRGARRLKRRRKHRIERVKDLLSQYKLLTSEKPPKSTNPYAIRVKGLNERLTTDELVIALLHLAKRRGIHNVDVIEDEKTSDNELSTKAQIQKNNKKLEDKYVAELQLERFNSGEVRGAQNRFRTSDFVKEAQKILETQQQYFDFDESFIDKYIKLLSVRREYYEGPGEGSPYGWDGDIVKWYEQLMGHCTYYPEEFRSVKYTYTADLYNALNDLNNLTLKRENMKLSYEEKWYLIENVFKVRKKPTLKQIIRALNDNSLIEEELKEEDVSGYRITKTKKPEFTSFKLYHDVKPILNREQLDDEDLLDDIARILTIYQTPQDIVKKLQESEESLTENQLNKLSTLTGYTGTHRLSVKLMKNIMDDLWHTPDNQMAIFSKRKIRPKKYTFEGKKSIPTDMVDDFILSPAVRRAFIQSIRVINAIIKKYGLPEDIVIELVRENNSDEKKKFLNDLQKRNEADNKKVREHLEKVDARNSRGLFLKLLLHTNQEGKCMYSKESIPLQTLLDKPEDYEIDHIIPKSISFDDSRSNKVLVKRSENQAKGDRTPYQYMTSGDSTIDYNVFKQFVLSFSNDMLPKRKRNNLLEERDITRYDVQKEFINRNLVDTRYTTRELMGLLKAYFKENELDVKVKSINGTFTNHLRKLWRFKKDRDLGYKHHAEDALVIASSDFILESLKFFDKQEKLKEQNVSVEEEHKTRVGEADDSELNEEIYDLKSKLINDVLYYDNYKYSHRVDKKPNRAFLNETIYSTRKNDNGEDIIIQKLTNIYDEKDTRLKKRFEEQPETFLMYKHDQKTFEKLSEIMKQYSDAKNPLAAYKKDRGEKLTKYSKNGNGPEINSLKYEGTKLGQHFDLSKKYINPKNKVVQLSLKPYRIDVYKDEGRYKFVTIRFINLKEDKSSYYIEKKLYNEKLKEKNITENREFIGTFHNNDLIEINGELFRLTGVYNDRQNKIEVNLIDISYVDFKEMNNLKGSRQLAKTIGKSITNIRKLNTDELGNVYKDKQTFAKLIIRK